MSVSSAGGVLSISQALYLPGRSLAAGRVTSPAFFSTNTSPTPSLLSGKVFSPIAKLAPALTYAMPPFLAVLFLISQSLVVRLAGSTLLSAFFTYSAPPSTPDVLPVISVPSLIVVVLLRTATAPPLYLYLFVASMAVVAAVPLVLLEMLPPLILLVPL